MRQLGFLREEEGLGVSGGDVSGKMGIRVWGGLIKDGRWFVGH